MKVIFELPEQINTGDKNINSYEELLDGQINITKDRYFDDMLDYIACDPEYHKHVNVIHKEDIHFYNDYKKIRKIAEIHEL